MQVLFQTYDKVDHNLLPFKTMRDGINKKKDKVLWKEQPPLMGGKLSYIEKERDAAYMKACFCLVRFRRIRRSFSEKYSQLGFYFV